MDQAGKEVKQVLTLASEEREEEDSSQKNELGDSLSILRFARGFKTKRLEISPSGFALKYHKSHKSEEKKTESDELVLTNMAF